MSVQVQETVHDQPDVSRVTPVAVPTNMTRSFPVRLVYIDEYQKYRNCTAFWDDVDKCWRYESNGFEVQCEEAVKTEPIEETKEHY